jgi:phosphopantetheinyl transferase (holo-ACP synthase)
MSELTPETLRWWATGESYDEADDDLDDAINAHADAWEKCEAEKEAIIKALGDSLENRVKMTEALVKLDIAADEARHKIEEKP